MTRKEAIEQLESLQRSSIESIDETDPEDIFSADVEAVDIAIQDMKKAALLEQETAHKNSYTYYTKNGRYARGKNERNKMPTL